MPALILAGHGSHISPHTAGLVWGCVDRLRALGVADEITACFWKEPPSFRGVLDTVQAREVVIVPVFTAQGYFTQTVIPTEMGLDGARTIRDGRVIHYARTLGEHPGLVAVVRQRVTETLAAAALDPQEVAVAMIGHGTPRSATSQDATRQQAAQLHAAGLVAEVFAVYLDDDPPIQSLYDTVRAPTIIAVPFFLAPGSHVKQDIPRALGLGESGGTVRGKRVFYTAPVGTAETLDTLMLDLARETGLPFAPSKTDEPWHGFPAVGQDDLWQAVQSAGTLEFGQLRLTPSEVVAGGGGDWFTTPAALRARVRELPFRPLPTTRDLPGGWHVRVTAPHVLGAVVETVYPGALADWARQRCGTFVPGSLPALAARQTGMFRQVDQIPDEAVERTVATVCGACIRHPAWHDASHDHIPCAEPCNFWLSAIRKRNS